MKSQKMRIKIAHIIGLIPMGRIRIFLYRNIFGYHIHKSEIGWRTVIVVDHAELTECEIGENNQFIGPMNLILKKGASIGEGNTFHCGWWTLKERFKTRNYERYFEMGKNTRIGLNHHFDVAGAFILGNTSWIGGQGSQFWTHGAGAVDHNIHIGEHCYIGSAVRFAPGSSIGNNIIVGLGSIVTGKFNNDENAIISGHPAKIVKKNYDWETKTLVK